MPDFEKTKANFKNMPVMGAPAPLKFNKQIQVKTGSDTLISYNDWMKKTALGFRKPRSSALKRFDKAYRQLSTQMQKTSQLQTDTSGVKMQAYDEARMALINWMNSKKQGWESSQRNTEANGYIISVMVQQMFPMHTNIMITSRYRNFYPAAPGFVKEFQNWKEECEKSAATVFRRYFYDEQNQKPRRMVLSVKKVKDNAEETAKDSAKTFVREFRNYKNSQSDNSSQSSQQSSSSPFPSMFDGILPPEIRNPEFASAARQAIGVGMTEITEVISTLTESIPFIAELQQFSAALKSFGKAAKDAYDYRKVHSAGYVIQAGNMTDAYNKLKDLIKNDVLGNVLAAVVNLGKAAAGVASAGATSILGAALKGLTVVLKKLFQFALMWREARVFNKLLPKAINASSEQESAEARKRIFAECPLASMSLLANASASDILDYTCYGFGVRASFQDEVEMLVKKYVNPIKEKARTYIKPYPYHFEGFAGSVIA